MLVTKIASILLVVSLYTSSCGSGKTDDSKHEETEGVVVSPGTAAVEAMEALEKADSSNTPKDSSFVCICEHKCKSKEECEKKCGSDCKK